MLSKTPAAHGRFTKRRAGSRRAARTYRRTNDTRVIALVVRHSRRACGAPADQRFALRASPGHCSSIMVIRGFAPTGSADRIDRHRITEAGRKF
jgi:hypothetical protein